MAYGNSYNLGYSDVNPSQARPDPKDMVPQGWQTYWANQGNPDHQREQFERGLMQGEQQRRQYDSETARQAAQMQGQKYSVLGGLMGRLGSQLGTLGGGAYFAGTPAQSSSRIRFGGSDGMSR